MDKTEPDILRQMSVQEMMDSLIEESDQEESRYTIMGFGSDPRPSLCLLQLLMRALSRDYPDRLEMFEEEEKKLNHEYGDPIKREYVMNNIENSRRMMNTRILMKNVGFIKIDEQSAYWVGSEPDNIDFSGYEDS